MATLEMVIHLADGYSVTIDKINKKTDEAADKILKASGQTDKFNKKLEQTGASANVASSGLGKLLSIAALVAGAVKGMSIADEFMNTSARLDLINDGLQTQAELQDKIFAAADRSKGSYSDIADAVAKMGLLAKGAFSSNDELIAFTELVQKSFKIGGADTSEQQGAMRQLSQAMASGRLQGDELVSIMENAPMIYDAIAKYTGLSKGKLRELGSDGGITADIIKNSMFMAGADIEEMFGNMPITFADVWNRIKNAGLKAFDKVIRKVNTLINTKKFEKFINRLILGIELTADVVSWLIDIIVDGWDEIEPILAIITGVYLVTMVAKLWAMIPPLIAQAGAWLAVYWPILLVIGAIGIAIWVAREFGATWDEIFNAAGGTVGVFASNFTNAIAYMLNPWIAFINFLGNSFTNLGASLKIFFWDIVHTVVSGVYTMVSGIASALNKLPGVDIGVNSNFDSTLSKIDGIRSQIKEESGWKEIIAPIDFMTAEDAYTKGGNVANNIFGTIKDKFDKLSKTIEGYNPNDFKGDPITVEGKGKNKKVEVDMSDEDLKYLRDIAEREYINKFSTATLAPNVSVTFGDVHENADADKLAGKIQKILQDEIAITAEGAYS